MPHEYRDLLLRDVGRFCIWERKRGQEPVWKRNGRLYKESEAVKLMVEEQQRKRKERSPDEV